MPDVDKLLNAIDAAEETAYGSDGDGDLASDRARAIDFYLGRNTSPAPDGRSQVIDRSVYETIQWIQPSLCRIFASGDDVVELPPIGPDDEESSKQEAQYLNHVILQKNDWFQVFDTASKDGLLSKAGYIYAYREKRRQAEVEKYERQTQESVAILMQDQPEVLSINEYPDPDYQPQPAIDPATGEPAIDPMTGQPVMQPPAMLYDLEIRRTKEEGHYCLKVLPPERCKISEKHPSVQLVGCPYFEYWDHVTVSELRSMGLEVPEDISGEHSIYETLEDTARDQYNQHSRDDENAVDPAMRRVKCRWVWIQHDYDEDGIAELNYVIRVGQHVLHREECNEVPVAVLCPDPLPHRHVGLSEADVTIDLQEQKTAILRQGMDNLYLSNNPRQFGDPTMVNLDDMLVSRPGGIVRTRNGAVYGQHFGAYEIPFVFDKAMAALEYIDQIRENRTGTNRYFTGIDQNALNKTATGIQQLSTMAAQRVEQIARHYANGVTRLSAILHAIILKSGHKSDVVKLRGQWVQVDPSTWRKRTDFRISVGFSAGNKDAQMSRLMLIAQMQEKAAAGGAPIVQPQNLYETAMEITKASDLTAPGRFWTDPATVPPPQPPQPDPTLTEIERIKAESQQTIKAADIQQKDRETAAKLEVDKYKADLDAQTKITVEQMKAQNAAHLEAHRADVEVDKAGKLEGRKAREQNAPALEVAGQVEAMAEELKGALADMRDSLQIVLTAKRQIRRGKDGKAEGVDIIGPDGAVIASQAVQRGPDGRVLGAG